MPTAGRWTATRAGGVTRSTTPRARTTPPASTCPRRRACWPGPFPRALRDAIFVQPVRDKRGQVHAAWTSCSGWGVHAQGVHAALKLSLKSPGLVQSAQSSRSRCAGLTTASLPRLRGAAAPRARRRPASRSTTSTERGRDVHEHGLGHADGRVAPERARVEIERGRWQCDHGGTRRRRRAILAVTRPPFARSRADHARRRCCSSAAAAAPAARARAPRVADGVPREPLARLVSVPTCQPVAVRPPVREREPTRNATLRQFPRATGHYAPRDLLLHRNSRAGCCPRTTAAAAAGRPPFRNRRSVRRANRPPPAAVDSATAAGRANPTRRPSAARWDAVRRGRRAWEGRDVRAARRPRRSSNRGAGREPHRRPRSAKWKELELAELARARDARTCAPRSRRPRAVQRRICAVRGDARSAAPSGMGGARPPGAAGAGTRAITSRPHEPRAPRRHRRRPDDARAGLEKSRRGLVDDSPRRSRGRSEGAGTPG